MSMVWVAGVWGSPEINGSKRGSMIAIARLDRRMILGLFVITVIVEGIVKWPYIQQRVPYSCIIPPPEERA